MKLKYQIKEVEQGKWVAEGFKWKSCYCDKQPFKVTVFSERRPHKKKVVEALK